MRLLYWTDPHVRGTNPAGRLDNYFAAMLTKLEEIGDLARQHHCDATICGGDLIDRPDTAPAVVGDMAFVLKRWGLPIYYCIGNHEIYGHNPQTIVRSELWPLVGAGIIEIIPREGVVLTDAGFKVQLMATHFSYEIDKGDLTPYLPPRMSDVRWLVHAIHGMLVNEPWPLVNHTLVAHLARETQADLVLSAHEHIGYGIQTYDANRAHLGSHKLIGAYAGGPVFVNPGAVCRLSRSTSEMKRRPSVLLIDLQPQGFQVQIIPLQSARPAAEVLNREQLDAMAYQQHMLEEYSAALELAAPESLDFEPMLSDVAVAVNASPAVIEEVRRRYERAYELLARK